MSHEVIESRIDVGWHDTDIAIVSLVGEHDLSNSDKFTTHLEREISSGQAVIVDLSQCEFIDSTILAALVKADRLAQTNRMRLTIQMGGANAVQRIFEISGLDTHLLITGSREEAIQAARTPREVTDAAGP